ncbi:MAG: FAD-dependent oxidoreductase [Gammaproteobacteria bacterium]|nr:FAD-dependent oxidoreductase [Gammaproteobacteria bacterium]
MKQILIIGGGIIGLCIAEKLLSQGHQVSLIERERIAAGASYGNAAGFAFSEIMPMASGDMIKQSAKWFLDPNGPFSVVARDLPHTANWLLRFALAARRPAFEQSLKVQSQLMQIGNETLPLMLLRCGLQPMVKTTGALYLYDTLHQYNAALVHWRLRERHGIVWHSYAEQALHDFQPGLSKKIHGGVHAPNYQAVANPYDFCLAIHKYLTEMGLNTIYNNAIAIHPGEGGSKVILENAPPVEGKKVILAAGPWSGPLSESLGDRVPLIGERGYNTTLPKAAMPSLDKTFFFGPHGFVISPLINGIRVGGASEIAKMGREPNFRRSETMLLKAKELVPSLTLMKGQQWMGMRPTTPDTLPVIGLSSRDANTIYAFGHGHLGLTQATVTAQLVQELVDEKASTMDITALNAQRF